MLHVFVSTFTRKCSEIAREMRLVQSGVICYALVTHVPKQSSSVTASELREVVFRHDFTYSVVQGTCESNLVLGIWLAVLE